MTKIDIFSGFLGAGKTTLIKKLIAEEARAPKFTWIHVRKKKRPKYPVRNW